MLEMYHRTPWSVYLETGWGEASTQTDFTSEVRSHMLMMTAAGPQPQGEQTASGVPSGLGDGRCPGKLL